MSRRTRTPANGTRAGTIPGQSATVWHPDTTWHERHPILLAVTKWFAVLVLGGLITGVTYVMVDLRDKVRDTGAKTEELPAIKERVRKIEGDVSWIRGHLEGRGE